MGSNIDSDNNNYMTLGKTIFLRLHFFICRTGTSNKVVLNEKKLIYNVICSTWHTVKRVSITNHMALFINISSTGEQGHIFYLPKYFQHLAPR